MLAPLPIYVYYLSVIRAVDPHTFFSNPDPDPAVLLNADPDTAAFKMRIRIQLNKICNKLPYEGFSADEKDKKDCATVKNNGPDPDLFTTTTNFL